MCAELYDGVCPVLLFTQSPDEKQPLERGSERRFLEGKFLEFFSLYISSSNVVYLKQIIEVKNRTKVGALSLPKRLLGDDWQKCSLLL